MVGVVEVGEIGVGLGVGLGVGVGVYDIKYSKAHRDSAVRRLVHRRHTRAVVLSGETGDVNLQRNTTVL